MVCVISHRAECKHGPAALRSGERVGFKAERSVFCLRSKQFTVELISGSEANELHSARPVNVSVDANVRTRDV